ncbi:MAG TPA: S24/S26 family peptidase [Syntrophobacteria bacterium]|nr:S24/S26 family peptidase [Syntrophobacteria bacterium]
MNRRNTNTGEGLPQLFAEVCGDLLTHGFSVRFRAPGWSMHPTIRDGEIITAEPVAPAQVKTGEVVLYRVGEALLAHRVVGLRRPDGCPRLLVRGDAPGAQIEGVTAGQILGRVVCAARGQKIVRLSTAKARVLWFVRHMGYRLRRWLANRILPRAEGLLP